MTTTERLDARLDREIPHDLGAQFQRVLGHADRPATLREWADSTTAVLAAADISIGFDELCTTDDSRHEATVDGETRQFRCVLDAMLLPFVVEETPVHVRSRAPTTDDLVELTVDTEQVTADPDTAVVSLGLASDVDAPDDIADAAAGFGHAAFCPYVNAFPDETAYGAWDEETTNATTMALRPETALAVAAALAEA